MGVRTEAEFHDVVAATLGFPSHYGRNKDAFWDCLAELSETVLIQVKNFADLSDNLRSYVADYIEIIHEAEVETKGCIRLTVES